MTRTATPSQASRASAALRVRNLLRTAGAILSSPAQTVNSVMEWLNGNKGLALPTLPLAGWPAVLTSLWQMPVVGDLPPTGPEPWSIAVDGSWPAIFPQVGPTPLTLEGLTIHVFPKP